MVTVMQDLVVPEPTRRAAKAAVIDPPSLYSMQSWPAASQVPCVPRARYWGENAPPRLLRCNLLNSTYAISSHDLQGVHTHDFDERLTACQMKLAHSSDRPRRCGLQGQSQTPHSNRQLHRRRRRCSLPPLLQPKAHILVKHSGLESEATSCLQVACRRNFLMLSPLDQ